MPEADSAGASCKTVRLFHQILLWPLQIVRGETTEDIGALLRQACAADPACPWRELDDEFPAGGHDFQERHYREFVTFLPHVQRFLYGERSRAGRAGYGESPLCVFRRKDIPIVRLHLNDDDAPIDLEVAHVDLYLFYDTDVVMLAVEVRGRDLPFETVQRILHRFGRAYPGGWEADGAPTHCVPRVEWIGADGCALSASDYEDRAKFAASVCDHQAAAIARHWEFVLRPMAENQSAAKSALRYRQLEYYRMPIMALIALDDVAALARADWMRLAFAAAPGDELPFASGFAADFEATYCYDRYFDPGRGDGWANTRLLCCGHALVAVGDARRPLFVDPERGFLAAFRHQLFYLGLIAHFHRAALLMLSDRLVTAISRLDIRDPETVRRFRRDIRLTHEVFLRFTHRYYFSEVSDQAMAHDLFRMWSDHLGTARLHAETREEINDMSQYLESDMLRRQAVTIVRLTVVTLFSLIGTFTTGFLGMNLFDHASLSAWERIAIFVSIFIPAVALTLYSVMKSQRLALFLDALSDTRMSWRARFSVLADVWRSRPKGGM